MYLYRKNGKLKSGRAGPSSSCRPLGLGLATCRAGLSQTRAVLRAARIAQPGWTCITGSDKPFSSRTSLGR